jgi:hypothetical protein
MAKKQLYLISLNKNAFLSIMFLKLLYYQIKSTSEEKKSVPRSDNPIYVSVGEKEKMDGPIIGLTELCWQ